MKIATLGPRGTFSERATEKYIESINTPATITFYPTITKVFRAIEQACEKGVLPIENLLDGFVHGALDLMVKTELKIIGELIVPVQFSFIASSKQIEDLKNIYVQFKTQGQCLEFLEPYMTKVITTESNTISYQFVEKSKEGIGAVVPAHLVKENGFPCYISQVTDSEENETRFLVLARKEEAYDATKEYKTSIIVTSASDEPGLLSNILGTFSKYKINLTSIMSRPTKTALGKYFFFIDFEGHSEEDVNVKEALMEINKNNNVKIMGSYYRF